MEKDIENLIEEMTKVRPEMLNEEALKLFNTIMAVLDERDKLIKGYRELEADNYECNNIISDQIEIIRDSIPKSRIRKLLDIQYELFNSKNQKEYSQEVVNVLEELLEEE